MIHAIKKHRFFNYVASGVEELDEPFVAAKVIFSRSAIPIAARIVDPLFFAFLSLKTIFATPPCFFIVTC